jgi:hypothetical protein
MKIARNLAIIGLLLLGVLAFPGVQASAATCGSCTGCSSCSSYQCGLLWIRTCCWCIASQ